MIKEDCFGYDRSRRLCKALKALYCRKEECNFYKTVEQVEEEEKRLKEREEY